MEFTVGQIIYMLPAWGTDIREYEIEKVSGKQLSVRGAPGTSSWRSRINKSDEIYTSKREAQLALAARKEAQATRLAMQAEEEGQAAKALRKLAGEPHV